MTLPPKYSLLTIPSGCALVAVILAIWAITRSLLPDACVTLTRSADSPYGLCACDDFSPPIESIIGLAVRLSIFVGIGAIAARTSRRQRMLAAVSFATVVAALIALVDPYSGPCFGTLRSHLPTPVWICVGALAGALGGRLIRRRPP